MAVQLGTLVPGDLFWYVEGSGGDTKMAIGEVHGLFNCPEEADQPMTYFWTEKNTIRYMSPKTMVTTD